MRNRFRPTFSVSTRLPQAALASSIAVAAACLVGCPDLFEDSIPPRPAPIPTEPIVQIDPSSAPVIPSAGSTSSISDGRVQTPLSFVGLAGSSLRGLSAGLPAGKQNLDGVEFVFGDAFLQLSSSRRPGYPNHYRIPVEGSFDTAYFLHATQYGTPSLPLGAPPEEELSAGSLDRMENVLVGEYVVLYRSGAERVIPLRYGQEIRDWWNWDRKGASGAATVWEIDDERAANQGLSARLFQLTWANPAPNDDVVAIEFRSAETIASPFCVAITVEKNVPPTPEPVYASTENGSGSTRVPPEVPDSGYVERQPNPLRDTIESIWGGPTDAPAETPEPVEDPAASAIAAGEVANWNSSLARLQVDRDRALADLADGLQSDIGDARARAALDNRNDDVAALDAEAARFRDDPYSAPQAPDAKEPAKTFFDATFARENDFLTALKGLYASRPAALPAADLARAEAEIAEVEASLARLALGQRLVASRAVPRSDPASTVPRATPQAISRDPQFVGPVPIRWKVVVDPPGSPPPAIRRVSYARIDSLLPAHLVYPPGPASFVQAGIGADRFDGLRLVDLRTGRTLEEIDFGDQIGPSVGFTRGAALSPAGDRWARLSGANEYYVVDPRADGMNRPATTFRFAGAMPIVMLPASDRCLVLDAEQRSVTERSLPQGAQKSRVELFATPSTVPGRYAVSPGGRYVVVTDDSTNPTSARFVDLQTGEDVGSLELAGEVARPRFVAFAFSHDGEEFAAYMEDVPSQSGAVAPGRGIVVWDVASGRPVYARTIEALVADDERSDYPLQWFPDGRGWLVMQRFVVSRDLARATQRLDGYADPEFGQNGAKILNDDQVLIAGGPSGLVVEDVDRGE